MLALRIQSASGDGTRVDSHRIPGPAGQVQNSAAASKLPRNNGSDASLGPWVCQSTIFTWADPRRANRPDPTAA